MRRSPCTRWRYALRALSLLPHTQSALSSPSPFTTAFSAASFTLSHSRRWQHHRGSRHSSNRGPLTSSEIADLMGKDSVLQEHATPLELNLFEDPSGGLSAGAAEELSPTEVEAQIRVLVSSFSLDLYYLLYTPLIDVVAVLVRHNLVPPVKEGVRAEEELARWFTDGVATLKEPTFTAEAMGPVRWQGLCRGLREWYATVEPVMPLTRAVRKHNLREDLYVPFFRQLSMDLAEPKKRRDTVQVLPGLILGLANGRAPPSLELPEDHETRVTAVAELFLSAGQETGNTDLAYLGIQLLRANQIDTPFVFQKQLTNVFSTAARVQTDWQTRLTGQLAEVYPRWVEYYKTVEQDNLNAYTALQAAEASSAGAAGRNSATTASNTPSASPSPSSVKSSAADGDNNTNDGDGGVATSPHVYFASRRHEDVERIAALEKNVEDAVRARGPRLIALAGARRRGGRKGGRPLRSLTADVDVFPETMQNTLSVSPDDAHPSEDVGVTEEEDEEEEKGRDAMRASASVSHSLRRPDRTQPDSEDGTNTDVQPAELPSSLSSSSSSSSSAVGKSPNKRKLTRRRRRGAGSAASAAKDAKQKTHGSTVASGGTVEEVVEANEDSGDVEGGEDEEMLL